MPNHILIERSFKLPSWNEFVIDKIHRYWKTQKFSLREKSRYSIRGWRGSLFGNCFSFDMKNLMAEIQIDWNSERCELAVKLRVNTMMQVMTEWNEEFLKLELDTFESYLLNSDMKEAMWQRFIEAYNKAGGSWIMTQGKEGTKIRPEDRTW